MKCPICGSTRIETIEDGYKCKDCGYSETPLGWNHPDSIRWFYENVYSKQAKKVILITFGHQETPHGNAVFIELPEERYKEIIKPLEGGFTETDLLNIRSDIEKEIKKQKARTKHYDYHLQFYDW